MNTLYTRLHLYVHVYTQTIVHLESRVSLVSPPSCESKQRQQNSAKDMKSHNYIHYTYIPWELGFVGMFLVNKESSNTSRPRVKILTHVLCEYSRHVIMGDIRTYMILR